jgi:serine O-acetyltransferase
VCFGLDILPGAQIGPGIFMPHPNGIVIGAGVQIGKNLVIMQGVCIGIKDVSVSTSLGPYPKLGDNLVLGTKSSVLGGITLGSDSVVAAHCCVLSSFPANSIIVGAPGRSIRGTK